MKRLIYEDTECLCSHVIGIFNDAIKDDFDIEVVVKYDIAKKVLSELCTMYDICYAQIENPDFGGYHKEYIIALNEDGVWCEPAYVDGHYLCSEPSVLFIHEDCNSSILKSIQPTLAIEFCIDENCEYNDCDEKCECDNDICECCFDDIEIYDELDCLHGFVLSSSDDDSYKNFMFYSTEEVNDDLLNELIRQFNI